MTRHRAILLLLATLAALAGLAVGRSGPAAIAADDDARGDRPVRFTASQRQRLLARSPLPDPPADPTNRVADDPAAAHLGQFLFFETRFSANGAVSCATCHDPASAFTDGRTLARGVGGATRHTPTLLNVAYGRWFGWDGAADTLWSQTLHAIEEPAEHGSSRLELAHAIHDDAALREAYETIFSQLPDLDDASRFPPAGRPVADEPEHPHAQAWASMTADDQRAVNRIFANVGKALAAYQRRLISRGAPFDTFVEGLREDDPAKLAALTPATQRGARLFVGEANCWICHTGPNFTDGEFHAIGVPPLDGTEPRDPGRYRGIARVKADPFNARGPFSDDIAGREAQHVELLAGGSETWGQFKTPTLRNVAQTPPYMHQGQVATLREVIAFYSTLEGALRHAGHQETILQPLGLSERQMADLEAFLESLSGGPLDARLLERPADPRLHRPEAVDQRP